MTNDEKTQGTLVGPHELPEGWVWTTVGAAAQDISSGFASGKHNQEGIGIPHFRPMNISATGEVDMSVTKSVETAKYDRLLAGDVVFNNTNSPALLGKTTRIAQDTSWAYSNHMTRIRPRRDVVEPDWLSHYLQHLHYQGYYRINARNHVNQSSINTAQLASISLPLASLQEQRRIVAKIEELLTRLDAGVAGLKRVHAELKRYRASVLKAGCEGRLVPQDPNDEPAEKLLERILAERRAKWEADLKAKGKDLKKAKYEEPEGPDTNAAHVLPYGWKWVTWETILKDEGGAFKRGPFGSALTKSIFVDSGYKVYEQYCAINDDCSFGRYYITPAKFEQLKGFEVRAGDYLMSCSGVTLGRITRVPEEFEKGIINQALLRFRINENIISHRYFWHVFWSPLFQQSLLDQSTGSAIPNVKGVKELKAIPIPLAPLPEQRRIVADIERRLSVTSQTERMIEVSLVRAERLRQAILREAFEGRLVGQDEKVDSV